MNAGHIYTRDLTTEHNAGITHRREDAKLRPNPYESHGLPVEALLLFRVIRTIVATIPSVSVVLPGHNGSPFLRDALQSLNTARDIEIIVVDDGSTDGTHEVVSTFESPHQVRLLRQAPAGLATARNRGLRESRGSFIVFLDPADVLTDGAIASAVELLDEHPECAFAFGRARRMTADGTLLNDDPQARVVRDHYRELLRGNYIHNIGAVMFRREALIRAGGFNASLAYASEYELCLHVARHRPVRSHSHVVVHTRTRPSHTHPDATTMLQETLAVLAGQRPFLEGDEASLMAYLEGKAMCQARFGLRAVDEVRRDLRNGAWIAAVKKATVLAGCYPRGLWQLAPSVRLKRLPYASRT
jgi:hypothetical protein